MASESILLPSNASLFITDKSWLRAGNPQKPGQGRFKLGEVSEVDGLSVTVVQTAIKPSGKGGKNVRRVTGPTQNRGLQFVNATQKKRGQKDEAELRRLVRSHVMTGTKRESTKRPEATVLDKKEWTLKESPETLQDTENWMFASPGSKAFIWEDADEEIFTPSSRHSWPSSTSSEMTLLPSNISTPLYGATPFAIQPQFHRFMNYYTSETASAMYPLQAFLGFNPVKSFWFPTALTDEILLHTIMYSAAVGLSQADPDNPLNDPSQLVSPIFRLLTSRLADQSTINDATIGAVSCLVMVENMSNNHEKCKVHMNGLQQMIKSRGGLEQIDSGLVMKIIRADVESSVDNLTRPILPPLERLTPTLYSTLPFNAGNSHLSDLEQWLISSELRTELKHVLLNLADFASAVQYYTSQGDHITAAIDPRSFDEDLLSITRNLLELRDLGMIEEAVQIAALILAKSIGRGLPFGFTGSHILPKRLRQALAMALNMDLMSVLDPALLWLLTMGGIASVEGQPEHSWFVNESIKLDCSDILGGLRRFLVVDVVHSRACKKFSEEVQNARGLTTN